MPEYNVELRLEATVYTEVEVTAPDERAAKLKAREKTEECGWLIDEADEVYVEVIDVTEVPAESSEGEDDPRGVVGKQAEKEIVTGKRDLKTYWHNDNAPLVERGG